MPAAVAARRPRRGTSSRAAGRPLDPVVVLDAQGDAVELLADASRRRRDHDMLSHPVFDGAGALFRDDDEDEDSIGFASSDGDDDDDGVPSQPPPAGSEAI